MPDQLTYFSNTVMLVTAMWCGIAYAGIRIFIYTIFPLIESLIWQSAIGGAIVNRWPSLAQSYDEYRPSYRSSQSIGKYFHRFSRRIQVFQQLSIGFLEGAFASLIYQAIPGASLFLAVAVALTVLYDVWEVLRHSGAERTDHAFRGCRRALIFFGLLYAVQFNSTIQFV